MAEKRGTLSSEEKVRITGPLPRIPPGLGRDFAGARNAVVRLGRWFARRSSQTWSIRWMKWPVLLAGLSAAAMLVGVLSGLPLASLGEHRVKFSDMPLVQALMAAFVCAGFLSFLLGIPGLSVVLLYAVGGLLDRHSGRMGLALGGNLVFAGCILTFLALVVGVWGLDREKRQDSEED